MATNGNAEAQAEPMAVAVAETISESAVFTPPHQEEHGENLDIPAFMRRGSL
jgi:hypothetical protein